MKIALLDLYEGTPNAGMQSIHQIIHEFGVRHGIEVMTDDFDVRTFSEVPGLDFDIYISSGGPGSPLESEGSDWEKSYFGFVDSLMAYNKTQAPEKRKYLFLICHSFQLFCRYYNFGTVCKRRKPSFGIYPVHKTEEGKEEQLMASLDDIFWIADFRKYQVIEPNTATFNQWGSSAIALEKERPHTAYERALMAIRFNDEIFGTQFHPEAHPQGMLWWFKTDEKKHEVIDNYGQEKYDEMLAHLSDPDKLIRTWHSVLPGFLDTAYEMISKAPTT